MSDRCIYITITAPLGWKKLLDRYAKKYYMKRSEFIRAATIEYIKRLEKKKS